MQLGQAGTSDRVQTERELVGTMPWQSPQETRHALQRGLPVSAEATVDRVALRRLHSEHSVACASQTTRPLVGHSMREAISASCSSSQVNTCSAQIGPVSFSLGGCGLETATFCLIVLQHASNAHVTLQSVHALSPERLHAVSSAGSKGRSQSKQRTKQVSQPSFPDPADRTTAFCDTLFLHTGQSRLCARQMLAAVAAHVTSSCRSARCPSSHTNTCSGQ
jgi:hypothetical protein